jgi:hypothetical protein
MSIYFLESLEFVVEGKDGYIIFNQQSAIDGTENRIVITILQFEEICRQSKSLIDESLGAL